MFNLNLLYLEINEDDLDGLDDYDKLEIICQVIMETFILSKLQKAKLFGYFINKIIKNKHNQYSFIERRILLALINNYIELTFNL